MNIIYYIKFIIKRKSKSLLTIVSIAISIAAVLIIGCISNTGKALISKELDSLGFNGITIQPTSASSRKLNNSDLEYIKSLSCVKNATPIIMTTGFLKTESNKNSVFLWGVDKENSQTLSINIIHGRNFTQKDILKSNNYCLIDRTTAESLFPESKKPLNRNIQVYINGKTKELKIIGIAEAESGILQSVAGEYIPNIIYLPYTTLQSYIGNENITQIAINTKESASESILSANNLLENFVNRKYGINEMNIENLTEDKTNLMETLDIVSLVLTIIAVISLIVSGLGTMTVMLFSISERTKEIGIKKSIGASRKGIIIEFLIESVILSVIGCIIGIILSLLIIIMSTLILNVNLLITLEQIYYVICVSLIFGISFGLYPAIKASKLNPVDALRRE